MSARIDFSYLNSLAGGPEDHAVLEGIEKDRERLLAGGSPELPGRPLSLTLMLGEEELRESGGTSRALHLKLRSDLAPASMDTFLEIFRDQAHALLPGFRGEEGGTVVDLGANEGYYTIMMKLLNPALRILAAEPLGENAALFRGNLGANEIDGVTLLETAVTDRDGSVTLETLPHVGTVASTNILAFPRPWIRAEELERRRVPTMTLGALLETGEVEEGEILKIDVEGSEARILSCGSTVLRRFRRVVVECHGSESRAEVRRLLESAGFKRLYREEKRSGDLYFLRLTRGNDRSPFMPYNEVISNQGEYHGLTR
jgi:FkbM family methyltransferase